MNPPSPIPKPKSRRHRALAVKWLRLYPDSQILRRTRSVKDFESLRREAERDPLVTSASRSALKIAGLLGMALFSAIGCRAFGLALWCILLAAHEAICLDETLEPEPEPDPTSA